MHSICSYASIDTFDTNTQEWRNGRRIRLKIWRGPPRVGSSPISCIEKEKGRSTDLPFFFLKQSVTWIHDSRSTLRFGRRKAEVHRTSCAPSRANCLQFDDFRGLSDFDLYDILYSILAHCAFAQCDSEIFYFIISVRISIQKRMYTKEKAVGGPWCVCAA